MMGTVPVKIVPIEDEIERAYEKWLRASGRENEPLDHRMIFDAGFRAARSYVIGEGTITWQG